MTPYYQDAYTTLYHGDCRTVLAALPADSVHCVVTSPPYWGLRDYGHDGQIGLEQTPEQYVAEMVAVFREVRRVLRDDGVCWLNLGDSYAATTKGSGGAGKSTLGPNRDLQNIQFQKMQARTFSLGVLKPKDLVGIPWRVAFALQADGWWLRQDIIWHKPNPMPESVTDRCTKAHEYIFLLTKSARYYYDAEAIREPMAQSTLAKHKNSKTTSARGAVCDAQRGGKDKQLVNGDGRFKNGENRNRRSVWTVATQPYSGAHFATFPPKLIEPCILAGCPADGTVLDPFGGSGTTAEVAGGHGRKCVLVELNEEYCELIRDGAGLPLFEGATA